MSVDTTGPHQLVVSVNDPEDVSRFKAALVNLIKTEMQSYHIKMLDYDGQTISTLKETTLVENLEFNEMSQLYEIKGYENPENGVTEQLMNHKAVETIFTETEGKNEDN